MGSSTRESTRYQRPVFEGFSGRPWNREVRWRARPSDRRGDRIPALLRGGPVAAQVAIRYTFWPGSHWGGSANREMKRLMIGHILQWADTVWFHALGSRTAAPVGPWKIGGVLFHITGKELYGKVTEMAFYRIGRGVRC